MPVPEEAVVLGCQPLPTLSVDDKAGPMPGGGGPPNNQNTRRARTPSYQPFVKPSRTFRPSSRGSRPATPDSQFPSRPQTPGDESHHGRPFTPDAFWEDTRPMSRASMASFRSAPPGNAWGSHAPSWGMKVAPGYGSMPKGTSRPATFSNLMRPHTAAATPSSRKHKRAEMPHLVDFAKSKSGSTCDVGLQAAPCMLTRFFFETSQQEHDPNTGKATPTVQHFDVVVQPDVMGNIDMSNSTNKGRPEELTEEIHDWLRRGHESVCLVTKVLPPDTFVDYDNVMELEGISSENGGRIWPALNLGHDGGNGKPPSDEELLSLSQYARLVARMEPRSADDSRQLIKLQRGILTAVVAMQDQILALHNRKVNEAAAELEAEKQRLHDEIAAPVQSKLQELQDKLAEREVDRVMLVEKDAELQQLQEKSAEQEAGFRKARSLLREKQSLLDVAEQAMDELQQAKAKADAENSNYQASAQQAAAQQAALEKERDENKGAYLQLKFSYNITRRLLAASKDADELARLQALLAEYEAQIKVQQDEIEALKKRLSNANDRLIKQEGTLKEMENKVSNQAEQIQEEFEDERMQQELIRRILAGHVARIAGSFPADLVPTVMPPNSIATIPQGIKAEVWSVVAMLHKEAIVCLPQSSAELPQEDGAEMLKPGEERAVESLPPEEDPSDTALKLQAECLDGLDPSEYAWVKVPIGAVIKWQDDSVESQALLIAGTIVEMLGSDAAAIKVHGGTTAGIRRDAMPSYFDLPKESVLSVPQSHATPKPESGPDHEGRMVYSLSGGAAFTWPIGVDAAEQGLTLPPGTAIVLGPRKRELSKTKSGMAALKGMSFTKGNCFWCRMRALGKDGDEDDVEEADFVIPGGTGQPRPGGLVGFREAAMDAMEDVGVFRIPISRTDGALGAVEIEITTQDGSANEVVDYKPPLKGRLRWEDGETDDKFVEIPIVYDDFEEDDETFYVVIENIVTGDVGIGSQRCCITIKDCGAPRAEQEGGDLDPSQLPWEQRGFREMKIPKPWKKMLGKINPEDAKLMAADKCRRMILAMYASKREADKVQDGAGKKRSRLDDYSAEFIRNYLGSVGVGKKLAEFIARLKFEYRKKEDNIVCMFVCLVGLFDAEPPVAHNVVVKALQLVSTKCAATGCNSGMFWSHLQKGKVIQMTREEAHTLLEEMITTKDQGGNLFLSDEVNVAECEAFLDQVCDAQEATGAPGLDLDRMLSFLVGTNVWLNKKAQGRVEGAYKRSASKSGKLDYAKFKAELSTLLSWNEPTQKMIFQRAQEIEGGGPAASKEVSVGSAIAATLELADVVCFSSVS